MAVTMIRRMMGGCAVGAVALCVFAGQQDETAELQRQIDALAAAGGGTLRIGPGDHRTGALFFKPGVRLHLAKGARLVGAADPAAYPQALTRIEGQSRVYWPAIVNADRCDGFAISGEGEIDGDGEETWRAFWTGLRADPRHFTNTDPSLLRPRVLYVSNSKDVDISGVTFRNSRFWTTHFYRCTGVSVHDCTIVAEVLMGTCGPSTDAIDIDNCRNVSVRRVKMDVNDDAVVIKGGKGAWADDYVRHPENGPTENVLVEDCTFGALCHACLTLGSECPAATNVVMRNCRVGGAGTLLNLKMRTDTPQHYADVLVEKCRGTCRVGLRVGAWTQYADFGGRTPAELKSFADGVVMRDCSIDFLETPVKFKRDDSAFATSHMDICLEKANDVECVRTESFVMPTRIVWATNAQDAALLLTPRHGQVPEGLFLKGSGCRLCATDGTPSAILLDFGRELHGRVQIGNGAAGRGAKVRVRFGESVGEAMSELGEKGAQNDHAIRDAVVELPWLGSREIGNTGFRFVRIDAVEGVCDLQFVRAVSVMRPMKRLGAFRCSDERLNRIFETAVRTVGLCCQDYLWDGIKRDRLAWTGDLHPETMAVLNVFGADAILSQTLDYLAKTTPPETWANGFPTYTLWWIRNLAAWYRFTGDTAGLARHADYLEKVFAHVATRLPDGVWQNEGAVGSFLDWPTHNNPKAEQAGAQALALLAVEDVRFLADALERTALANAARDLAEKMRTLRPDACGTKSTAALLALSGLREPREMFAEVLSRNGHADVSTFYGYYMIEAMSASGEGQRALDTVRDYWGGMLDMGATSFWEDFNLSWTNNACRIDEFPVPGKKDIHGDFGNYCYKGFRHSLCHGWSSGPASWCVNRILGIRPLEAGCRKVAVEPFLGDLEWAEGAMALPDGSSVKVAVRKAPDGSLKTDVSAPDWVEIRVGQK